MDFAKQILLASVHHCAWADRNVLDSCAALTQEELDRDFRISHAGILSTLRHTYDGERVWLDCLQTTPDLGTWRLPPEPGPPLTLEVLRRSWPELWRGYDRWLKEVPVEKLATELNLQLPGEIERRFQRWKILRHVLEHSALHCGQIVGMVRMLGHQPPSNSPMDYYLSGEPVVTS